MKVRRVGHLVVILVDPGAGEIRPRGCGVPGDLNIAAPRGCVGHPRPAAGNHAHPRHLDPARNGALDIHDHPHLLTRHDHRAPGLDLQLGQHLHPRRGDDRVLELPLLHGQLEARLRRHPRPSRHGAKQRETPCEPGHRGLRRGEIKVADHPVDHLVHVGQPPGHLGIDLFAQESRQSRQPRVQPREEVVRHLGLIVADKPGSLAVVRHFRPIVADKSGLPRIACPRLGLCEPFIPVHLPAAPPHPPGRLRPLQAQSHARPALVGRSERRAVTVRVHRHMVRLPLPHTPAINPRYPPRAQALTGDLLREAGGVGRRGDRLRGEHPGSMMVSVTVAPRPMEARHDHDRSVEADHAHHVLQHGLAVPAAERLLH